MAINVHIPRRSTTWSLTHRNTIEGLVLSCRSHCLSLYLCCPTISPPRLTPSSRASMLTWDSPATSSSDAPVKGNSQQMARKRWSLEREGQQCIAYPTLFSLPAPWMCLRCVSFLVSLGVATGLQALGHWRCAPLALQPSVESTFSRVCCSLIFPSSA